MKFDNGGFSKKTVEKLEFGQTVTRIMDTLREDLRTLMISR